MNVADRLEAGVLDAAHASVHAEIDHDHPRLALQVLDADAIAIALRQVDAPPALTGSMVPGCRRTFATFAATRAS